MIQITGAYSAIAKNLVDFERLIAKCRMQIEKYKIKERFTKMVIELHNERHWIG